ncbi:MAG: peptidase S41 [Trueperaceae bacterium]|nr:MAG: peptidase S41 [Trueperaceae bacterium]
MRALLLAALLALGGTVGATSYEARFDVAWRLVAERYWDLDAMAIDWDEARVEYGPAARDAADDDAFYTVLETMYERIGDDHTAFVRPERVAEFRQRYGDLPCLGVFGVAGAGDAAATPRAAPALPDPLLLAGPVAYGLLGEATGYVRIDDLVRDGTSPGVRSAVDDLLALGAESFVLDLRGNPGGRLVTMMQVAGVFTSGFLWRAVTTWSLPVPYPALGATLTDAPLAVLVDGDVHSAAEGLAGALQMSGRAIIVGATTAGNVEAVLPFCLRDGSQAWVATGVLAPIGGPTWEGRGVTPDVETTSDDALGAALDALTARP